MSRVSIFQEVLAEPAVAAAEVQHRGGAPQDVRYAAMALLTQWRAE